MPEPIILQATRPPRPAPKSLGSEMLYDMVRAQRSVRRVLKNKQVSYEFMVRLLRSWRRELSRMRRNISWPVDNRTFQRCEMIIAFAEDFHAENIRKHESYKKGNPDEQDIRQLELRRTLYR
jgi:hypothetical protein